jgi:hypothetical protein
MIGSLEENFPGTQGGLSDMVRIVRRGAFIYDGRKRVDVGRLGAAGREW